MWNKQIILLTITEPCLNREFPQEQLKHFLARKIWVSLHGPMTWKVMPRNVWNDILSWQTRRLNNSTKYLLHASMTTTSNKKKWNLLENCHMYALKLFWNAYSWHELGRPDILWSVFKLARSITKWTKACDKRLNRLLSYIHHTCDYKQYCHVGNITKQCRCGTVSSLRF